MHAGLEDFLWKISMPNTPSYNINTDLKYTVTMWFYNGVGETLSNPFLTNFNYNPKMLTVYGDMKRNSEFAKHGTQALDIGTGNMPNLGAHGFDLTPFIQSIQLPDIGTTASTDVRTMLGTMKVGAYSPYTSDGGREISFTLLDTQYSILDAIFYPWLKMIGNSWWYHENTARTENTTPYPICILEVSTPMRWYPSGTGEGEFFTLNPYVYSYLGARPKSYDIPEINAESRNTLTRRLTMVCDLVLVDMDSDSIAQEFRGLQARPGLTPLTNVFSDDITPILPDPDPINALDATAETAVDTLNDVAQQTAQAENAATAVASEIASIAAGGEPGDSQSWGPTPSGGGSGGEGSSGGEGGEGGEGGGDGGSSEDTGSDSWDSWGDYTATVGDISQPVSRSETPDLSFMMRDGEHTKEDIVCAGMDSVNERYRRVVYGVDMKLTQDGLQVEEAAIFGAKMCLNDSLTRYPSYDVLTNLKSSISENFDTVYTSPILRHTSYEVASINDVLKELTYSESPTPFHTLDFFLCDAKQAGGLIREASMDGVRKFGNYSRLSELNSLLNRIEKYLPDYGKNKCEAYLAIKSVESLFTSPNNSLAFNWENATDMWQIGLYLTPLHNALVSVLGKGDLLQPDAYPFLFRYVQFRHTQLDDNTGSAMKDTREYTMLKDAVALTEAEMKERKLGDSTIGSAAVWEIVDDKLNHTGNYWCKAWLKDGKMYFCKVNYLGTVITEDLFPEGTELPDTVEYVNGLKWLISSTSVFKHETAHVIYNGSKGIEVRKGGQCEKHFNPLTAIEWSKRYCKAVEYTQKSEPTGYWHIEELPQKGDVEYENAIEWTAEGDVKSYSMHWHDEGQEQVVIYVLEPKSSYVVQSALESYTKEDDQRLAGMIVPMRMGFCPAKKWHNDSGHYDRLFIKRHNCWEYDEEEESKLKPYETIHTTNSYSDLFEDYIPKYVDYVAQYKHHKARARVAYEEQRKVYQELNRMSKRIVVLNSESVVNREIVRNIYNLSEMREFLSLSAQLEEASNEYNSLTDSEIRQENKLASEYARGDDISERYDVATEDNNHLDERFAMMDEYQMQVVTMGRAEERIHELRRKQRECVDDYGKLMEALKALISTPIESEYDYINGKTLTECIDYCAEIIYSQVCISWSISELQKTYNELKSYYEKREDRRTLMDRVIAFFDRDIANLNSIADDDDADKMAALTVDDAILLADWMAWGDGNLDEESRKKAAEEALRLRRDVKAPELTSKLFSLNEIKERVEAQREKVTTLVYDVEYATPGTMPKDLREQEPLTLEKKETKKQEEEEVDPEDTYQAALSEVLPVYRSLHAGFKEYSKDELTNSLLLVLSSTYLKGEGLKMQEAIVKAKSDIEKSRKLKSEYMKSCNKEKELIRAADGKRKALESAISKLDKDNEELVKRNASGTLPRDEQKQFRFNVLQKVDQQAALDSTTAVLKDLLDHYENKTLPTLNTYDAGIKSAEDSYDSLLTELMEKIDFKNKVIGLASDVSQIRKYG